jgi:putative ABC transport system permease protein
MTVAFVNLVFTPSLFNGIIDGSNKQIINTLTGDVYVTPPNGSDYINQIDQVVSSLSSISGVKAVSAKMVVPARLKYQNINGSWQILAVNPNDENGVSSIPGKISSGSYLDANDTDQIVIGRQIAGGKDVEENALSFKGAKVGDKVNVIFDGGTKSFIIKGIYNSGFVQSDERAFITNKALKEIMPNLVGKATTVNIRINNSSDEGKVINSIENDNLKVNVYSWQDSAGLMKSVSSSFLSINVLLSLTSVMIAAVTIIIIIYVTIINKRKEIGILRAIGIKPYIIISSYVILSAVYAIIGIIVGTAAFFLVLVPYFQVHPFVLPICNAVLVMNWPDYAIRAEAIMAVSIIGGFIPALVVTRAKMLDAILGK